MQFLTRILFQDFKDRITKLLFFSFQVEKKNRRQTWEESCINELLLQISEKFIINVSCWICEWKLQVF